jgi:hypothetical protein
MQNAHRNEMMMLSNFKDDIQVQYDKVESSQREEEKLKAELIRHQNLLEQEKRNRVNDVNEKEREKIQATEKLRKDMLYKIKETKSNLLALNDEQL